MLNLKLIPTKEENMPTIEATIGGKKIYLYSKYDPNRDTLAFAESIYNEETKDYLIYGIGLGYHIDALVDLIHRDDYHIYVFECNKDIFKLAHDNLEKIMNNKNITVVVMGNDKEYYDKLNKVLSIDDISIGIHRPSLTIIPEEFKELKYLLEEFVMTKNTMESTSNILDENFKSNIKYFDGNVDRLFDKFRGRPIYIVSAGPSLDKNIQELAKVKNKGLILSVGRAAKPLLSVGIVPDFIILTDPSKHLYNSQLRGLDIDVSLIVLSTADKNIMMNYKGKKYITLQEGYPPAEEYGKANNHKLVRTGGSVATTALDVAIRMGCNPIVFVGQDLGFTDNKSHSSKTYSRRIFESQGLRDVEDIYGNTIQTSKNLYIYLRWIQNRIAEETGIEFIDATEGGARIRGTKVMRLKEVIDTRL